MTPRHRDAVTLAASRDRLTRRAIELLLAGDPVEATRVYERAKDLGTIVRRLEGPKPRGRFLVIRGGKK